MKNTSHKRNRGLALITAIVISGCLSSVQAGTCKGPDSSPCRNISAGSKIIFCRVNTLIYSQNKITGKVGVYLDKDPQIRIPVYSFVVTPRWTSLGEIESCKSGYSKGAKTCFLSNRWCRWKESYKNCKGNTVSSFKKELKTTNIPADPRYVHRCVSSK